MKQTTEGRSFILQLKNVGDDWEKLNADVEKKEGGEGFCSSGILKLKGRRKYCRK